MILLVRFYVLDVVNSSQSVKNCIMSSMALEGVSKSKNNHGDHSFKIPPAVCKVKDGENVCLWLNYG